MAEEKKKMSIDEQLEAFAPEFNRIDAEALQHAMWARGCYFQTAMEALGDDDLRDLFILHEEKRGTKPYQNFRESVDLYRKYPKGLPDPSSN